MEQETIDRKGLEVLPKNTTVLKAQLPNRLSAVKVARKNKDGDQLYGIYDDDSYELWGFVTLNGVKHMVKDQPLDFKQV